MVNRIVLFLVFAVCFLLISTVSSQAKECKRQQAGTPKYIPSYLKIDEIKKLISTDYGTKTYKSNGNLIEWSHEFGSDKITYLFSYNGLSTIPSLNVSNKENFDFHWLFDCSARHNSASPTEVSNSPNMGCTVNSVEFCSDT